MLDSEAKYLNAAIAHDAAIQKCLGPESVNKAHDDLIDAAKKLVTLHDSGQGFFLGLLNNENTGVKLWAALHVLPMKPRQGLKVLKRIMKSQEYMNGISAEYTIKEWLSGNLDPHWFVKNSAANSRKGAGSNKFIRYWQWVTTF